MLKLPGFSLKVIKYVGDKTHCLRYVFKNRKTGDMYFNVNFNLLWGEELQNALEKDSDEMKSDSIIPTSTNGDAKPSGIDPAQSADQRQGPSQQAQRQEAKDQPSGPASTSTLAAPTTMQLHPGDHQASAKSISNSIETQSTPTGTTGMKLHPGDHNAAAETLSTKADPAVDEIDRLLQKTSTSHQIGGRFLDEVD